MDSDRCLTCLYGDKCSERHLDCDFYCPFEEFSENEMIEKKIDVEYIHFIEEWIEYTDEERD